MAQLHEFIVKPSLFASPKKLSIHPAFIEFNNINFPKLEIAELRYGVKAINGYRFVIGRTYCIDIRNADGKIIKLRWSSLYSVRKKLLNQKYAAIVNALFENYFNEIITNFIQSFFDRASFILLGNTFTQEGIILSKTDEVIDWNDVGTRDFRNYFLIFSKSQSDKYSSFYYLADWNTIVLKTVTRYILESKGMV